MTYNVQLAAVRTENAVLHNGVEKEKNAKEQLKTQVSVSDAEISYCSSVLGRNYGILLFQDLYFSFLISTKAWWQSSLAFAS